MSQRVPRLILYTLHTHTIRQGFPSSSGPSFPSHSLWGLYPWNNLILCSNKSIRWVPPDPGDFIHSLSKHTKVWGHRLLPCLWVSGHLNGATGPQALYCVSTSSQPLVSGSWHQELNLPTLELPALNIFLNIDIHRLFKVWLWDKCSSHYNLLDPFVVVS